MSLDHPLKSVVSLNELSSAIEGHAYRIFPPNDTSFNICFLGSGVAPFKEFFCAGLHPVHYGLPYIYFGHTKWSGCFMMGNIICVIQWVWLWCICIAHQQRLKASLRDFLLTAGIRALQWSDTITMRSPASWNKSTDNWDIEVYKWHLYSYIAPPFASSFTQL